VRALVADGEAELGDQIEVADRAYSTPGTMCWLIVSADSMTPKSWAAAPAGRASATAMAGSSRRTRTRASLRRAERADFPP
jgi:hypothetical protein